uniref:Uncharacterized protein n=1 Tax=Ananas comosus var. bracteatus TaxID=296719 RepID=A0A6V7NEL8_ANACO|nr:unnamed protein product [Ananas comosus var. bracteatus]
MAAAAACGGVEMSKMTTMMELLLSTEQVARWERQTERRQLFLRSYHFSRHPPPSPAAPAAPSSAPAASSGGASAASRASSAPSPAPAAARASTASSSTAARPPPPPPPRTGSASRPLGRPAK